MIFVNGGVIEVGSVASSDNTTLYKKGLDQFYCADLSGLRYGGDFRADFVGRIKYKVVKCDKSTELLHNIQCASKEEWDKYVKLNTLYFAYFYYDTILDVTQFDNPIKVTFNFESTQNVDMNSVATYNRYYYYIENVISDTGVIFEDNTSNKEKLKLDYKSVISLSNQDYASAPIIQTRFYITKKSTIHKRNYINIPDIAAQVWGIFSFIHPVLDLFIRIFIDN